MEGKELTIGIIGLGNMGSAIASALADSDLFKSLCILAHTGEDTRQKAADLANAACSVIPANNLQDLLGQSQVVLICVKPQVLPTLYEELGKADKGKTLFISIAAGVPLSILEDRLGTGRVVRFMPNIAAKVKKSVTAICLGPSCTKADKTTALAIAESFGSAFPLDERLMPAFIGISGSGIAYIYQFIHAMAEGGCLEGIPYPQSHAICYATMESAVALALGKEGTVAPMELEMKVCSAGGTTIEGVKALEEGGLNGTVIEAVAKTAEKSRKMEDAAKGK